MDNIYKNTKKYNLNKKHKVLIVIDDTTTDIISN